MIPYRPVFHSPGFYPITTFYAGAIAVLVFTVEGFFTLAQGIVLLALCGIGALLLAAWRDLKAVHVLVNGAHHELKTEIADLKQLLRDAHIPVPAGAAEKRDQTPNQKATVKGENK